MGMTNVFEASKEQKKLANLGREMMDYSQYHPVKGISEQDLRMLNNMSQVGNMLTTVGATFGATYKDFTVEDRKLIVDFINRIKNKQLTA
jgi:hypothetical protein|tara:strand:- start:1217 stop:1486 length:270 start_codon:yes stop_codon:yes gene_type:complete